MSRVKTTARAYRLGCGCVHEFASLPAVSTSAVVCSTCGDRTTVAYRYPDSSCAATTRADNPEGGVVKVRCTHKKQHSGRHFDATVNVTYDMPNKLRSGDEGRTR